MFLFFISLWNIIRQVSADLRSPEYNCDGQVVNNTPMQDYTYPNDYIPLIYDMNSRVWVQTVHRILLRLSMFPELVA